MRGMIGWFSSLMLAEAVCFAAGCARPENAGSPFPSQKTTSPDETNHTLADPSSLNPQSSESSTSSASPSASSKKTKPRLPSFDERFLFRPSNASVGNYRPDNLKFEDVSFRANDGTRIHGWYCPCENPRAYVLFAHGNAGNVSFWADRMRELQKDYKVSVLIFDYRGYGKSEGRATVTGVLQDARAAATFLANKAGIKESELVLMGQSLGGAVAVHLAAEIAPKGLILESTFSSFRDVADHHAKWASWLVPQMKLNSAEQIGKYRGPLLQCHGDRDTVVPFALGRKLFAGANDPKTFIEMKGCGHNTPLPRSYRWKLDDFLQKLASQTVAEQTGE